MVLLLNFGRRIADADADFAALARDAGNDRSGAIVTRPVAARRGMSLSMRAGSAFRTHRNFVATDATVQRTGRPRPARRPGRGDRRWRDRIFRQPMSQASRRSSVPAGLMMARQRDGGRTIEARASTRPASRPHRIPDGGSRVQRRAAGQARRRSLLRRPIRSAFCKAKDGWIGVTMVTPAQWRGFCDMLRPARTGADPDMTTGPANVFRTPQSWRNCSCRDSSADRRRMVCRRPGSASRRLSSFRRSRIWASTPEFHARGDRCSTRGGRALQRAGLAASPREDAAGDRTPGWLSPPCRTGSRARQLCPSPRPPRAPKGALCKALHSSISRWLALARVCIASWPTRRRRP